jgi:mono/diheme cytochrome c family protein
MPDRDVGAILRAATRAKGRPIMARMALLGLATALAAGAAVAQGPNERPAVVSPVVLTPDEREFLNSCASCHGVDGKGAGFLTRLFRGVDPGDLTQLAAENGGTFPLDRVFAVIDGREEVEAHGPRQMPVWGDRYMARTMTEWGPDELNALRVENRIYALAHYLQSIQEAAGGGE